MRVFVTGATGFIGRALIPRLRRDGHAVVAWARSEARALERCDGVVNLAGEPLMETSSGWAVRSDPGSNTCRGFISTIS